MLSGPLAFYTVLDTLVSTIATDLESEAPLGRPDRVCIVNGAIAWDECECGQLVGTTIRWFYADSFPNGLQPEPLVNNCPPTQVIAEMAISVLRCAPGPQGNDLAPTCAALAQSAQDVHYDAFVVRRDVACGLDEMKANGDISDYHIMDQTSVGPDGQCVGTDMIFYVSLDRIGQ